ncbi:MAG: hypothetical protein ACYTBJ_24360, partial [Planctomycetota bacterium]
QRTTSKSTAFFSSLSCRMFNRCEVPLKMENRLAPQKHIGLSARPGGPSQTERIRGSVFISQFFLNIGSSEGHKI